MRVSLNLVQFDDPPTPSGQLFDGLTQYTAINRPKEVQIIFPKLAFGEIGESLDTGSSSESTGGDLRRTFISAVLRQSGIAKWRMPNCRETSCGRETPA